MIIINSITFCKLKQYINYFCTTSENSQEWSYCKILPIASVLKYYCLSEGHADVDNTHHDDTIPCWQCTKKMPGSKVGWLVLLFVQMLDGELVSKQKSPCPLTIGRQGKYSRSWTWPESPNLESVKESTGTLNGALAFSNRSLTRAHKALGRWSPSMRLMMSNNSGQDCWRSSRSPGDCLTGTLFTNLSYKDSNDSHCGRRAHTGEDFPNATKRADTAGGNGTSVPKVEMHQLRKISKEGAQRCNSTCKDTIVVSLTLLTSCPTWSTICLTHLSIIYTLSRCLVDNKE